jgi:hypothetical protein
MVNILYDFLTKDITADLALHIFRKIVLCQPPRVWSLIFTPQPLHSNLQFIFRTCQRHRFLSIKLLNQECLKNRPILSFKSLLFYLFTNICTKYLGVKPIIHQSELRTYTKVVHFKENSSFRFVALWQILNGME